MSNTILKESSHVFKHYCKFTGYAGGTPYFHTKGSGVVDGIGRMHVNLYGVCDICNKETLIGKIHLDKEGKIKEQKPKK